MNTSKKPYLLIALFVMLITSIALCQAPQPPITTLQFETNNNDPCDLPNKFKDANEPPKYTAVLRFKCPQSFFAQGRDRGKNQYLENDFYETLKKSTSQAQQHFIANHDYFLDYKLTPYNICELYLYAVTEEDIKVIAESTIKWWNKRAVENSNQIKRDLEFYNYKKLKLEGEISPITIEEKELAAKIEDIQQPISFQDNEEAKENIKELNKKIISLKIEAAGIQAKLDVMVRQSADYASKKIEYPLEELRITSEINLAELLAKQKTAESCLNNAITFLSIYNKLQAKRNSLQEPTIQLQKIKMTIASIEEKLTCLEANPLEFVDTKIIIHTTIQPKQ